ncbi:MAG: dihydrolipoyl dehydrogenase [Acidobacteria bacterium]|nr:dihydrolipoyl dehydrogenase [Acidobacteriota bacterium]
MVAEKSTDLVVLGAGPGGYAAAFRAADLGMSVSLVDPAPHPGGVCLYRGCIPSKALLHVARLLSETEEAAAWGINYQQPEIDLPRLRAWKDAVVTRLTSGLGDLEKRRGVEHVRGYARFRSAGSIWVDHGEGETTTINFKHAILATGSRPVTLPMLPEDSGRVMDSTAALDLPDIPSRLLVVGGGYIGLELGSVYARLGSKVTVVEMLPSLLTGVDSDLVRPLAKRLAVLCEDILLETRLESARETDAGLQVTLTGKDGQTTEKIWDRILVAVGRRPNSSDLGLENTRVEADNDGFIQVDAARRTAEPGIFAIGDVTGQPMLAHKAAHEARVAVESACGRTSAFEPRAIPAVVFTDPEIAWCGLTEAEARAAGTKVEVARFPWAASGRAATLGRDDGLSKLIMEPETRRLLGVGLCGPGAGELIAEGVLALEMDASVDDLALTIHPHPTLSETIMEAAEVFDGHSTHFYRPPRRR